MQVRSRILSIMLIVAVLCSGFPLTALKAQDNSVVITVALPNFMANNINDNIISEFEAAYPGVKFKTVDANIGIPDPTFGLDNYYTELEKYVSTADVLMVSANTLAPEGTLAGYYLDLAPLVSEDTTLNSDDFYPAVWQSFQWDKGVWALPFSVDSYVLTYDAKAFDDAGLAYPSEQWTFDDLVNAAKALVQKDADGKVTRAGIDMFSSQADAVLFRSLLGENLFDTSVVPNAPKLDNPTVASILTTWQELETDGVVGRGFNTAPISVSPAFALLLPIATINGEANDAAKRTGLLLPGGKAGLDVNGFAVSAGTQHPKEAYELAKFLTTRPEIANGFSGNPARQSLVGKETGQGIQLNVTQEVQDLVKLSIENGIPLSDMRYLNYVSIAYTKMKGENIEASAALQEAEATAQQNLQAAADKKSSVVINVATPVPDAATTADGRIVLKFGLSSFFVGPDLINKDEWDRVIADFVASDPQVGGVDIKQGMDQLANLLKKYDCVYQPYNAVANADLSTILSLDPFMDADANFDKSDVVGDVLTQLTRDGKIWGYPFTVEPAILKYNADAFNKSGAVAPTTGWTVDEFNNALKTLKINPEDPAPFEDNGTGGNYLLIMMAAYGGIPLDFRTDPPTINYTDPKTVDAIRQVLNLAKDGYLKYTRLGSFLGGAIFVGGAGANQQRATILTETLNAFGISLAAPRGPNGGEGNTVQDTYLATTYPRGTEFTGASYNIGIGLISATAQSPEGCYRFFNAIAKNPKLFQAMPARRSLINNGETSVAQSENLVALYNDFDKLLSDPNTIIFPSQLSGGASPTGFLLQYWLYKAFDAYILDDKDLDTELATAEQNAKDFQECAKSLPPLDATSQETAREYIKAFGECATKVDPSLSAIFSLIK
ncbi:MAG: hypothetical protein KF716_02220 [Anaerolineae bacterium]|nr:hypothetical protein [Anaerolineae bacterium]